MAERDVQALWINDYFEKGIITDDPDSVFALDLVVGAYPTVRDSWVEDN